MSAIVCFLIQGKTVWSLDDKQVTCIAGSKDIVAVGNSDGQVIMYRVLDWLEVDRFDPPTPDRTVSTLEFIPIKTNKEKYDCLLVSLVVSAFFS